MTEQVQDEARTARSERPIAALRRRGHALAVAGAIVIVGALAVVALQRPGGQDSRFAIVEQAAEPATAAADPLMTELIRCRALPPQVDDPDCRAVWEENRRRFFGERRATRVPGDPLPRYAPIPMPGSVPAATER